MAGMFYSLQEAAEKLNLSEEQLKEFVQEGKLREFRDGPNLLFKVDEVEALIPEVGAVELEAPEIEEEAIDLDLEPTAEEPEAEEPAVPDEGTEVELEIPEPEAEIPETSDEEPVDIEDISELEALSDSEVPSLEDIEAEMAEVPETEEVMPEEPAVEETELKVPEASETASDSEILLAPETGSPLMSSDLTDADTALTGLGTSVLGETDQGYEITDDTMAETAVPMGTGGTTPEVPLEEIESDVNLDTFGSGSGLLDLSLQADDTSLGGILDEIYTADEEGKDLGVAEGDSAAAMAAEADQMVAPEEDFAVTPASPEMAAIAGPMIELAPDSQSNTLGMLLFLPLAIVIYTIVVAIAGLKGIMPSILASIQAFIWYIMGGAALVAGLVVVAAFMFTGERSATPKAAKEKKAKVKKEKKPKEPKKPKENKPKKEKPAKKGFLRLK